MFGSVSDKLLEVFASIVNWFYEQFKEPFKDLPTLKKLVFGELSEDKLIWGTFKSEELTNGFEPLYNSIMILAGFALVIMIVLYAIRIAGAPLNPTRRNEGIEFIKDLVLVGILLTHLPTLYDLLFTVNSSIVNLFSEAYSSNIDDIRDREQDLGEEGKGIIGWIFIQLVLLGLTLWASFYYMMRKITLLILMGLGPLMIVFWMQPQLKGMTGAWLRELVGSIFVQAIHAFVFWTVAVVSATSTGFVETVIVYVIFIPIAESLRRMLNMGGDMQGGFAKAGAMMGMAGLAGMYGAAKGALDGKSVMGTLKGAYNGTKSVKGQGGEGEAGDDLKKTLGGVAGGDRGTTPRAEKMLRAGDILGKSGKAVFGAAGSIAGMGLGPVGSMTGASAGFAAGGVLGGVAGRGGMAALHGIQSRLAKGKEAANAFKAERQGEAFDEAFAGQVADRETASWADANYDNQMKSLRERFPDASQAELDSKFDAIKAQKRDGFYNAAKGQLLTAKGSSGLAKGSDLATSSAHVMTNQWAAENRAAFMDDFEKNNPRQDGESLEDYSARKAQAFATKKAGVRSAFENAGNQFVAKNTTSDNPFVSKSAFMQHMGEVAKDVGGLGHENVIKAGQGAVNSLQSLGMFDEVGAPNVANLATGMAQAKTNQMRNAFVSKQVGQGISAVDARKDWDDNHQANTFAQNLSTYQDSAQQAVDIQAFQTSHVGAKSLAVGAMSSLGITGGVQAIKTGLQATTDGGRAAIGQAKVLHESGEGTRATVVGAAKTGWQHASQQFNAPQIEEQGGAVNAHQNFTNSRGYAAGVLFGTAGYQAGKSLANKLSPFAQQVQSEIHSPGEVIKMAKTTTDSHGNVQIAPGAIRQVTTAQESFIEVTTKSGETKIVSRKGSGHSGLQKGDAVYQDLSVDGDMLVPSSTSTYRLDSAGGRAKSSVVIESDPSMLLGNARLSDAHAPAARKNLPVFSQSVDNGMFYTQDLAEQGFENVQVVVEKDRQFVTGEKDGMTYRVSQVFSGDSRLSNDQTVQIPVEVSSEGIKPKIVGDSSVAVESNVVVEGVQVQEAIPYFSTKSTEGLIDNLDELIQSKHYSRAIKSVDRRKELEAIRRKQGILG